MDGDSEKLADHGESGERYLVDAAWAQFETLATRHRPRTSDSRRSLAIPGYRILREIHRGGQGVVYQAIQESTQRKVAIKLLKEGPLADPIELARFDREVDVLSRLDHPHIVAIHDRGQTEGHAYYVMDYVPGRPLDAYVAAVALSAREILILFHEICEAVNVAHLRGVIHRDLKPSNIRIDDEGEPHVLDFGLAKMTRDATWSATGMTETGQFVGSLPWASPEQAEGRPELLDIRTDVYSLGVILYQLLTGSFPYPVSGRMDEVVRNIIQTGPARPSTLVRNIDRDVEVILLKCLAKDPERRYQSAGELARDLQRNLNEEPIEARPATSFYQFRQFARRNRPVVASVITIMFILATATAVSLVFAARARRETGRATREAGRAEQARLEAERRQKETQQVADFQSNMLREIDVEAMGRGIKEGFREQVRSAIGRQYVGEYPDRRKRSEEEIDAELAAYDQRANWAQSADVARRVIDEFVLERAGQAVEKEFADQPLVQADIRTAIGTNYQALGLYAKAEPYLRAALELRQGVLGAEHEDVAKSLNSLASLLKDKGDYAAAEPLYRQSLAMYGKLLGDEHPRVADCLDSFARLLNDRGDYTLAEPLLRESLAMRRKLLGDENLGVALSLNNLAMLLTDRGDYAAAEPLYRESLAMYRKLLGDENPQVAGSLSNLAKLLGDKGEYAEAEALFREALAIRRKLHGDEHPYVARCLNNLGWLLNAKGDYAGAEPLLREALALHRKLLGDAHPEVANSLNNLAALLQDEGEYAEAEPLFREALAIDRGLLGDENPYVAVVLTNLASLLQAKGDYSEAESFFREALAMRRKLLGEEHWKTLNTANGLGNLLRAMGRPTEAIALLVPLEPAERRTFTGGNALRLGRFLTNLGRSRADVGEFEAAEANLTEAHAILLEAQGARAQDNADVLTGLAELYDAWHAARPDLGYDAKAAAWRAELVQIAPMPRRPTLQKTTR